MFHVVESSKSFSEVIFDLEPVVQRLGFVILHASDLGEILRRRESAFDDECAVFDVANFRLMDGLLAADRRLAAVLPWRIVVYTEDGVTRIGLLRPESFMAALPGPAAGNPLAHELAERLRQIVAEVR